MVRGFPDQDMKCIYLSHVLTAATPLYGGAGKVEIQRSRSISNGDSSNCSELVFPAHSGTHVDAPWHFDPEGETLDQYPPDYWSAKATMLLDVPSVPGEILDMNRLRSALETVPGDCDLLLLRTGAEAWRKTTPRIYAENGPCIGPDVAAWLRTYRNLKFLGIDFISVSSFAHRQLGHETHRAFLGRQKSCRAPILLIEDMFLSDLVVAPLAVSIVPLLFSGADAAPVTVIATLRTANFQA